MATRISTMIRASFVRLPLAAASLLAVSFFAAISQAQTQGAAVPVPFTSAAAGTGVSAGVAGACTTGILATSGVNYGDGCPGPQAGLSSPQGAAVDKFGNVYVADYSDRLVRVVYNGNPLLAAAIKAANSGYAISATRSAPAPTPVVGNIYTIAGTGITPTATTTANPYTITNPDGNIACAAFAGSGADAIDGYGDGCPAASAPVGPRDVKVDNDGNLFITDYTYSRVRVVCVNCAAGTLAAALITLENPGVTPVNGAIYTIVGFTNGYRDQAIGYGGVTAPTANVALLRAPTGAVVSASDDVFIADNTNNAVRVLYNGGTAARNILTAEGYTPTLGYVYTIAGSGCVSAVGDGTKNGSTTSANSCLTTAGSDTPGLGAQPGATVTTKTTGGTGLGVAWSVYLDPNGNVYYTDATNARVKVIYGGIAVPLTIASPTVGFTYSFAGQGTGTAGAANGVAPSAIALTAGTGAQGVGGDASGNIFFADYTAALFYETFAQTGITAIIGGNNVSAATAAAGNYCNGGTTGPQMTDAFYDGCPLTQTKISGPRGPLVSDNAGNLYFGDSPGYFIRRFSYNPTFPATAVGATSAVQPYAFTFLSAQIGVGYSIFTRGAVGSNFSGAAGDTCVAAATAANSTCSTNVQFTPTRPGVVTGSLRLSNGTAVLGDVLFSGIGVGAGLNVDPGTVTTTGTATSDAGITVDGAGRVLVTDLTSKSLLRYTASVATTVATGFTTPTGVAIDGAGNIFVADSSANTITEIPVIGARFTLASGLNAPRNLAVDGIGNLYVADTGNNRVLQYGPGATIASVVPFTGLTAPQAVAVDANGNVYATDSTHTVRLAPATGVQTTVATGAGTGVTVAAGGNVYVTSGTTVVEYPASGTASVTIASGLVTPRSLASDLQGNLFIADSGQAGYVTLNRTAAAYNFTTYPATQAVILSSSGNTTLTAPTYTQTDSTDFSLVPSTTNGCSGALAAGTACSLTASFNPVVAGTLTDVVTFNSSATNGSPITLTLTGTATAQATTTTLGVSPATLVYGNVETLTATVAGTTTAPSTGTVNFYRNLTTLIGSGNVTAGVATFAYVPAVGTYSVTAVYVPSGATYATSTSTAQTFTVTPATLTVTANNASKLVGAANPALTYSITGFVNSDTTAVVSGQAAETTTATTASNAGTYPITITQGTLAASNYTFTFVNGTLTVTGATAQTITFGALPATTYGAAPITLTATSSSGLAVTYTVTGPATINGSVLTITGAGTVSVTATQTGNNTYAAATPVTQSFTVAKAALTVTATSMSRTYGSANAALAYTVTGFVNTDTQVTATTGAPTETTTATQSSNVGAYPITITQGTLAATNYTFTLVNGTLTVTPATLTLNANSFSRSYGAANPTFTGTISGAVNSDVLTETFTTTATAASPAGTYAIVPGATGTNVGNYTLATTNGSLTITQVKPLIGLTTTATTGISGTTSITLTATVTSTSGTPTGSVSFFSGATLLSTVPLTGATAALVTTTLPVGTDSITAVYLGDTNFSSVTSTALLVTIAPAFGVTSSTLALAFQPHYQEAQAILTINPGGRTDTLTFACQGLPAKLNCAFNPATLALSGVTTAQTVQMLVSNSGATASLNPAGELLTHRTVALAALPLAALLLFGLRRRRRPSLMLMALLMLGAATMVTGCGMDPSNLNQASGSYPFTVTVSSGSTVLQTLNYTLTIP